MHDLWALRLQVLKTKVLQFTPQDSEIFHVSLEQVSNSNGDEDDASILAGNSLEDHPRLLDTISLCYIGTLILRLPLSLGTLHK